MGTRPVVSARLRLGLALLLGLTLLGLPLPGGAGPLPVAAASSKPNLFDPRTRAVSVRRAAPAPAPAAGPRPGYRPLRERPPVPMAPARVDLEPSRAASLVGSDGRLEVEVPAGAVSAADVSAAGGRLSLEVRQVLPPSGGSAGGSGRYSFGTYVLGLVDGGGGLAGRGLRHPLELRLHPDRRARALDLEHAVAVLDPYARHEQSPGGGSPLEEQTVVTPSRRQRRRREAGSGGSPRQIPAPRDTNRVEGAAAWVSRRVTAKPDAVKGPPRRRGGSRRKVTALIRGDLPGCRR